MNEGSELLAPKNCDFAIECRLCYHPIYYKIKPHSWRNPKDSPQPEDQVLSSEIFDFFLGCKLGFSIRREWVHDSLFIEYPSCICAVHRTCGEEYKRFS